MSVVDPVTALAPLKASLDSDSAATYKVSIFRSLLWLIHWLFIEKLYYITSFFLKVLTGKIHITISFSTVIFIALFVSGTTWLILRYRYFNIYEKLSSESYDSNQKSTAFIDSRDEETKSGFSSYLEEFLSAIKIFGYLDKPVFHELTRSMKTQRLDAGELFALDNSLGFSIVVEGSVNVYSKVPGDVDSRYSFQSLSNADETYILNGEKFQLINYVKTGNPLSSLISILSLFTGNYSTDQSNQVIFKVVKASPTDTGVAANLEIFPDYLIDENEMGTEELSLEKLADNFREGSMSPIEDLSTDVKASFLPDLIAQAKTDCTIAVIPADSFRRLTRKWPRAASHIVQVVLTRLYRVTFQTAHNYFGLTNELFQTEIRLNEETNSQLPKYLCDSVVKRIDEQILEKESNNDNITNESYSIKNPPKTLETRRSSFSIPSNSNTATSSVILKRRESKEDFLTQSTTSLKRPVLRNQDTHSRHVVLDSRNRHHPGDLLSNVPISRAGAFDPSYHTHSEIKTRTFSAEEETEDTALRIALTENIFKFLGIDEKSLNSPILRNSSSTSLFNVSKRNISAGSGINDESALAGRFVRLHTPQFGRAIASSESSRRNSFAFSNEEQPSLDYDQAKREFADGIKFLYVKKGTTIIQQSSPNDGLYYVVSGSLDVSYLESALLTTATAEKHLYTASTGCIAGYLASLVGHKSLVTIRASSDSYLGFLPKETIDKLCEKYFTIHLSIARKLIQVLDKDLLDMDFAVEWVQAKAGHSIYKQDMDATGIYLVLSGRFRELKQIGNEARTLGEYGQGSSLGELEVLTASKRQTSLVAVRESEAARIPRYLFEFLALKNPSIMIKISRLVAKKVSNQNLIDKNFWDSLSAVNTTARPFFTNYKTITVLPTKYGLPVTEFAEKLVNEFKRMGKSTIILNQASTLNHLGRHAFDKLAKLKQSGYFSDLEERYQLIVYVTDTPVNFNWTHTCISQGDCILLLADASGDPAVGDYERLLLKNKTSARTELVLLHPDRFVVPGSTNKWLKNRLWVEAHHHIQFHISHSGSFVTDSHARASNVIPTLFLSNLKSKVETLKQDIVGRYKNIGGKAYYTPVDLHKSDFARLARILSGQAIGLVLGGGGARGIAHIGVIQTLEKQGIPIDLIGGTSIGSFVGGLYAKEYDIVPIYGRAKKFAGRVASIWRTLSDLTYPLVAYTTGHEFNRGVWKAFGDSRIEDFWIRYYCNSTNITNSVMEFHTSGYAWRFIRASMTLCGLVPPIVDHGNMLLDGGYVDNLPVSEMKRQGANIIFAVDVGSVDDRTPMTYGDTLSGGLELINRYNPFSSSPSVPSMADIQLRLAYVQSVNALEKAKATPGVLYLRPPIENYGTLAFGKFNEIYDVGAEYATKALNELRKEGKLPDYIEGIKPVKSRSAFPLQRRNSI